MRYSYGIVDRKKILAYKPQLFRKADDLLVFPGKDFDKWCSDIREYIDGLYQINAKKMQKQKSINITDLNLAIGILTNITDELEHLFDTERTLDFSYKYVSTLDEKYKKRRTKWYGRYMEKIDRKAIIITDEIRYKHLMEVIRYAYWEFDLALKGKRKKQKKLSDLL